MKPRRMEGWRRRAGRVPLLVLGVGCLLAGIWGGVVRLPVSLPLPADNANWITYHGPLMVCGFLGTVISLERAVGLQRWWAYAAPLVVGLGAGVLVGGRMGREGLALIAAGSLLYTATSIRVAMMQAALFTVVMAVGAAAWSAGNLLWLYGWAIHRVVLWWIAFLGLTIVGERLDLARLQGPVRGARPLFLVAVGLVLAGVVWSMFQQTAGERLAALGMLALAGWLARFDIARRTIRQPGLPRFMAICLLAGYVWMAVSAVLLLVYTPLEYGYRYDAVLHSFFIGFVFSMIFGHAPVIFPAILQLPVVFANRFYVHVVLLHGSLLLRLAGDLTDAALVRQWGAILNGSAVLVFFANTLSGFLQSRRQS